MVDDNNFVRPLADPDVIVSAWKLWTEGKELPGRTMADLKIGGLDLALAVVGEDKEIAAALFEHWTQWEKGRTTPSVALEALTETGLGTFIDALVVTAE